jgi:hypothetical protein
MDLVCACPILHLYELVEEVGRDELRDRWGIRSFTSSYIRQGLWEDRWGHDPVESGKVRKLY